jgi:AmiR/NasT family two-component response regulator
MRRAMETRAVIEQAKGIIVAQQHCTPEQAFELLTRLSQSTHRKLRDCAADLVTTTAEGRLGGAAGGCSGVAQVMDDLAE